MSQQISTTEVALDELAKPTLHRVDAAEPPDYLSEPAQMFWREIQTDAFSAGTMTQLDLAALGQACEVYADWLSARQTIAENGGSFYYTNAKGHLMLHPAYNAMADADRRLLLWLREFGMTPRSRTLLLDKLRSLSLGRMTAPNLVYGDEEAGMAELDLSQLTPDEVAEIRQRAAEAG